MASGVFGLKKVYKRQVENINNGNFASWTEDFSDAYIMSGQVVSGTPTDTVLKYSHFDGTSLILGSASNISPTCGRESATTVSNYDYGYYAGGNNPNVNTISRLDFSTNLNSLPGTNLPTNVTNAASVSRVDEGYGYFVGGQNPTIPVAPKQISTITRLDFSTETLSPMPNLPTSTHDLRGFNGTIYGYTLGGDVGNPPVAVNTIYRLDFSNNTLAVSLPSKNLTTARTEFIANESPLYGYASAGQSPTNVSSRERLDFSTETTSTLSSVTPVAGGQGSYFSSITSGYSMGINNNTNFSRLDFSTETTESSLSIAQSRQFASCVSARHKKYNNTSGTFAYVNQGSQGSQLDKMSYQTETWTNNVDATNSEQRQTSSASSNSYGYIFGGGKGAGQTSIIARIDFSLDLLSSGKKGDKGTANLLLPATASLVNMGTTQTNSYAYLVAGTSSNTSYTWRMDFSTEDFVLKANFPGGNREALETVKSPITSYIGLGNNEISTIYRLNFSTETYSTLPSNYPIALINRVGATATSASYSYGYFLGGESVSSIYRLDLSSETFSLVSNLVSTTSRRGGYSYNDLYGYFNCLQSGDSSLFRMDFGTEVLTTQTPSPASRQDSVALTNANT
jgi:hypothetical protein